jgi:hypothetical protein
VNTATSLRLARKSIRQGPLTVFANAALNLLRDSTSITVTRLERFAAGCVIHVIPVPE